MREDDVLIGLAVREVLKIPLTYLDWYYFGDQTTVPPDKIVEEALTYPQIRIRNNANRDLIDKSIWNIIERKLQL